MISDNTIEQVKDLSIVDVVSKYVPELKKLTSDSYRASSPFTNEKSPSFYVKPSKGIFKCFSTGKGGDHIRFVMEKLGLTYPDAIKELCANFQIRVEYDSAYTEEQRDELEMLYKVAISTANCYAKQLLEVDGAHPAFLELINKRRFSPDTIMQWQIGFAPGDVTNGYNPAKWNYLYNILKNAGCYKQGIDLKLIKTQNENSYDVFRNRVIYPIQDHNSRVVGFGGRALYTDQYNNKYINSEDSTIYKKSNVLFGLNFAGKAIREKGYANMMEGYTDVISFHQAGLNNTIGTCGTALTEEQAKLLRKFTTRVVLFNDPDEAGQNAASRSIDVLMRCGFQTSVVPLPSIVELKREKDAQPWREKVFITQRDKDKLICKYGAEILHIENKLIESIDKVDPDELVRMFI
jgi:DNA primase